jgi:hypothetical protein
MMSAMRMPAVVSLFALVLALGGGKVAQAQKPAKPSTAPSTAPSTSAPSGDFGFDLGNEEKKKTPAESATERERLAKLERKVHLRRSMLQWHQALGFITLAALAVTDVIGTLSYYDKYTASGTDTGQFTTAHEGLAIGTSISFAATGILALAAPNPYPKPLKLDAALLHKMSMLMATVCFAAQIVMGPIMAVSDGKLFQKDMALAHVVIGYGAFAFMGVGTLAYVF